MYAFIDDDGTVTPFVVAELNDGAVGLVDSRDSEVITVIDAYGNARAFDPGEAYIDDPAFVREAKVTVLEAKMAPPGPEYEPEPQPDYAALAEDVAGQIDRLVAERGHEFTRAEATRIAVIAQEDHDAGREVNVERILWQMTGEGNAPLGLENRQERRDWMTERLQDGERAARGQGLGEADPPAREDADLDDGTERRPWEADRIEGRADLSNAHYEIDAAEA